MSKRITTYKCMYCDKRWLMNEIGVNNVDDAFILTVGRMQTSKMPNLRKGDILLFDRSQRMPSNTAYLLD